MEKVKVFCSTVPIKFKGIDRNEEWLHYHALCEGEWSFEDTMDLNADNDAEIERLLNDHIVPQKLRNYLAIIRVSDNTILWRSV